MIKRLNILRIVLSVAFVILLTGALLYHIPEEATWLDWTCRLQLLPAVLSLSAGVCLFWLVVTLLIGRAYCSTICPLGVVQDIFGRAPQPRREPATIPLFSGRKPAALRCAWRCSAVCDGRANVPARDYRPVLRVCQFGQSHNSFSFSGFAG